VVDSELMNMMAVAAADFQVLNRDPGRCEVAVGPRTYALDGEPEALRALVEVALEVVPRLRTTVQPGRRLSAAEAERLAPFVERFREMGILLFPGVEIADEPARRLYSFVSRRSVEPDKVFTRLAEKGVRLSGPPRVVEVWQRAVAEQGLTLAAATAEDAALSIVMACEEESLAEANRRMCAAKASWLPVLFGERHVRVGPWVRVGDSGCLRCYRPPGPEHARGRGAPDGWAALQPGVLNWAGGLVAELALRALLPMAADHPWGKVTLLDVPAGTQSAVTAWRDPFCSDCAEHSPAPGEWAAL
jgi:hypothetical protein